MDDNNKKQMSKWLLIAMIAVLFFYYKYISKNFVYNHNVLIYDDAYKTISGNDDRFLDKLNKINLQARNTTSITSYKSKMKSSLINKCSLYHRRIINKIIEKIKKINVVSSWTNNEKFQDISWNIIITKNQLYEYGLPHTRYNKKFGYSIIIPLTAIKDNFKFQQTLLHEQLHIYQKLYIDDTNNYINKYYMVVEDFDTSLLRANPDTDFSTYKNNKNEILCSCYTNNKPKKIIDVKYEPINKSKYEHPYEFMVYNLVNKLLKN